MPSLLPETTAASTPLIPSWFYPLSGVNSISDAEFPIQLQLN